MATREQVEATLQDLLSRFEKVDGTIRLLLPAQRTVEAICPDIGLTYHAHFRGGRFTDVLPGTTPDPDIRLTCDSDDLVKLANRELSFSDAFHSNRVTVEASMTDQLVLRSLL